MERIWFVKDAPLFERLTNSEIRPLEYRSRARTFPRGSSIFLPDDPVVFLITEGRITSEVAYWHDQRAVAVELEPGDFFGIVPGCGDLLHGGSAKAILDATIVAIPSDHFRGMIDRHADLMISVTRRQGWTRRRVVSWLIDLVFRTTRQRIARLLLSLVGSSEFRPAHEVEAPIPLSIKELTHLTLSDYGVVEYVVGELITDDLIRCRGNSITLLDPRRLAHLYLPRSVPESKMSVRKRVRQ